MTTPNFTCLCITKPLLIRTFSSQLFIDKDKPPHTIVNVFREMSGERCARLISVGIANELREITMASPEFVVFYFLALNFRWLIQRLVAHSFFIRTSNVGAEAEGSYHFW